ncbi:unnamed protein product, partial [marine sediment metagenome]
EVTTVHYGGGSFQPGGKRWTLVYRGRMLFARKHYSRLYSAAQRAMFGAAAMGRLGIWLAAAALPQWRDIARKQVRSNAETLGLCFDLR